MSDYRYTAVIATVSNSFCDAILDYSVNRFNYQKVLFLTCLVAFIGQVIIGLFTDISFTSASSLYIIIHAFLVLIGYICFIRSLEFIPIALVGLIETSSLFLTFVIWQMLQMKFICIFPYRELLSELVESSEIYTDRRYSFLFIWN